MATDGAPTENNFEKSFPLMSHTLNRIQGPLVVEGGVGPEDRSVKPGVTLPGELNPDLPEVVIVVDESAMTDTLNVYNDSSVSDDTGVMSTLLLHTDYSVKADGTVSATLISGLGMGTDLVVNKGTEAAPDLFTYKGGIAYTNLEVAEVLLGTGNDTFTVTGTRAGTATAIHGGGGADTLIVTGGGGSTSPLVLYGDTSEDGSHYTSTGGTPSSSGIHFDSPGADTIDASASSAGVTIYGGPGDDVINGSQGDDQIAGGLGDDTIHGEGGDDIVYGDSGFNATLSSRTLAVPTTENPGIDTIYGDGGNDIIFGDHGIVTQAASGLLGTGGVNRIETTNEAAGLGDTISGGDGDDRIYGGLGADAIEGNAGNDTIFGDHGVMDYVSADADNTNVDLAYTRNTASGGIDTIYGNDGDDTISAVSRPTCSTAAMVPAAPPSSAATRIPSSATSEKSRSPRVSSPRRKPLTPARGQTIRSKETRTTTSSWADSGPTRSTPASGTTSYSATMPDRPRHRRHPEGHPDNGHGGGFGLRRCRHHYGRRRGQRDHGRHGGRHHHHLGRDGRHCGRNGMVPTPVRWAS